jgi:hypothetical protein
VWEILEKARIKPTPHRPGPFWSQFLGPQADATLPCGFCTADLLDGEFPHMHLRISRHNGDAQPIRKVASNDAASDCCGTVSF